MIPVSKIYNLSQQLFVGSVTDKFGEEIIQKVLHVKILIYNNVIKKEEKFYVDIFNIINFNGSDIINSHIIINSKTLPSDQS